MSEFGNPLSYNRVEPFADKEAKKIDEFIHEVASQAATILMEKHYKKNLHIPAAVDQKNQLRDKFTSLLQEDKKALALNLFGNTEIATAKMVKIGEAKWLKK